MLFIKFINNVSLFIVLIFLIRWTHEFIDADIEEVEREYDQGVLLGKAPRPAWDDIKLPNRSGRYVKYQLDMILPLEVYEEFERLGDEGNARVRRNAVRNLTQLWPQRTIPYRIDSAFSHKSTILIMKAIQYVMQYTCVVFIPHTDEQDFVYFQKVETGCNSFVGRHNYENTVKLAEPKCLKLATVVHEIGHVLGLYHEHMRHDRDQYVNVLAKNIMSDHHHEFDKLNVGGYDDYQKEYDYTSLMHYSKSHFGIRFNATYRHITLEPTDIKFLDVIGNCTGFSYPDLKIINSMYQCAAGCQHKTCMGGFLGKNCECYCPGPKHDPAQLCEQQAQCVIPETINPSDHYVVDEVTSDVLNLSRSRMIDTEKQINIQFNSAKMFECGSQTLKVKCNNGIWSDNMSFPCITEKCELDPSWDESYELGFGFFSTEPYHDIPHGEFVDLSCLSNALWSTLTCDHGDFIGDIIPCTGKDCTVDNSPLNNFIYTDNAVQLDHASTLEHGQTIQILCKRNMSIEENVTCIDGEWKGNYPDNCPYDYTECPVIPDAVVSSGVSDPFVYNITCITGFEMKIFGSNRKGNTNIFTCTSHQWKPYFPKCKPAKCQIPSFGKGNATFQGTNKPALVSDLVDNGDTVSITCDHGHIPDTTNRECHRGQWNIKFPFCKKVVCGDPGIQNVTYSPHLNEYVYMDRVLVDACEKNKEFIGSKEIICERNGQWSGSAKCQKYCIDGKKKWRTRATTTIEDQRKGEKSIRLPYRTNKECKNICTKYERFLCLSISVVKEKKNKKARSRIPVCYLHSTDLIKYPDALKRKVRWTSYARVCDVTGKPFD